MLKGIQLTLMIGPAVPVPVSKSVLDALRSVEVTTPTEGPSGFQLQFTLSNSSPLHTLFLLSGGSSIPLIRVLIVVTINGSPQVLMDGVMTNHETQPGASAGQSTLAVTGEDLSRAMDYVDFSGQVYPAMAPAARVVLILAKYAVLGVIPRVIPAVFSDVPIPTNRIPVHQGTDLDYTKQLASEVGHVFYVDPSPAPGTSIAYWGPRIKGGVPQPALNINMDTHTNVESLSFNYNSQTSTTPEVFIQNEATKQTVQIPTPSDISPLNPPLGEVPPVPLKFEFLKNTARFSPLRAAGAALARAANSAEAVTASGTLDVLRYGRVLKARQLVGARGAGAAFNGLYYVESVTHNIERGKYTQSFNLSRNGLRSTVSRVVP